MRKTILFLLTMLFVLSACAPDNPEVVAAQNTNPVTVAESQAVTLQAITEFMNAAQARQDAKQSDNTLFISLLFIFFGVFVILSCLCLAYLWMRTQVKVETVTHVTNNYLLPVVRISPMGRIIPIDDGSHTLEAGQNVTELAKRVEKCKQQVRL